MRLAQPALLRQLRVFCVAARSLSFKSAAASMYLTPSAVSHQIRELEAHLGVKLFERKTRALELTADGQQLLQDCEPLLVSLEDAVIRVSRRRQRRALRLALPAFFAIEHPASTDVSVLLLETAPAELVAQELFPLQLVAACAPSMAERACELGRSVFREAALIVQRARRDAWERWARDNGLTPPERRKVIELDSMYSVVRAAEQGLGIALVPEIAARAWFTSGSLVRFSAGELQTGERYYLVHRPEDAARPEIVAFHDWAVAEFRAL